ncbi:MAG: DUF6152 family protein [Steroidobacteraceae bacterium]
MFSRNEVRYAIGVAGMTLGAGVSAHHSTANFDTRQTVEFRATVTKFEFNNPHSHLYLERASPEGVKEQWLVELPSVPAMRSTGITSRDKFKPGDVITFRGSPDRDPKKKYVTFNRITKEDGTVFGREQDASQRTAQTPKGPGSSDFTGTWSLMGWIPEGGTRAFFDPVSYSVTQKGKTVLAEYAEEKDPVLNCEKHGLPRSIYGVYPRSITRKGNNLEFHYEYMDVLRTIHMDQKSHPANAPRSHIGHSIGRMEGNILVIETANFSAQRWGNGRGLDSSDQKQLVERYTMGPDGHTMKVTFTLTDPVYLTQPVVETFSFSYSPEYKISDFNCDVDSAKTYLNVGAQK